MAEIGRPKRIVATITANTTPGSTIPVQTVRSASRNASRGTGRVRTYSSDPSCFAAATTWGIATSPIVRSVIAGAPVARNRTVPASIAGNSSG